MKFSFDWTKSKRQIAEDDKVAAMIVGNLLFLASEADA